MSVRSSLESIFSHLYPAAAEDDLGLSTAADGAAPAAEDAAGAPPPESAAVEAVPPPADAPDDAEASAEAEPPPPKPPPPSEAARRARQDEDAKLMTSELETIQHTLEVRQSASKVVNVHLTEARHRAAKEDQSLLLAKDYEYGLEQRKTGLPMDESMLRLDASLVAEHGLLHPRQLLQSVQEARAARACETKGDLEDMIAAGEAERPPPHYMQSTGARDAMMETKKYVVASTVKSIRQLREQKAAAAAAAGLPWPPPKKKEKDKKAEKMTMEQLELEEKVMRRVQAPLAFARNPRFVLPPRKPVSEAAPQPPRVASPDMWILCKPERVNFTQYEVGGVYEIPLELHNVSALSRRVRILPTTTRFFSVTLISYLGEDSGMIAPGMHAVARVRFAPDSLADFDDVLVVQTEKESFPVPLTARRSAPSLTLPASLDAGYCFTGGSISVDFGAQNLGGAGARPAPSPLHAPSRRLPNLTRSYPLPSPQAASSSSNATRGKPATASSRRPSPSAPSRCRPRTTTSARTTTSSSPSNSRPRARGRTRRGCSSSATTARSASSGSTATRASRRSPSSPSTCATAMAPVSRSSPRRAAPCRRTKRRSTSRSCRCTTSGP